MAVEAASLSRVTDATRFIFRFITVSSVVSNPSRMNRGWLGSVPYSSFRPITLLLPRISKSGMRLGSEPNWTLSEILNEGASVRRLCKTLCVPTALSSLDLNVVAEPVKLSFLRW